MGDADSRDAKRKALLRKAMRGELPGAEALAELRGNPAHLRVTSGGSFSWTPWLMRGAALLIAVVLTLMAPVMRIACERDGPGTVACTFTGATAGVREIASERYAGVAAVESTPDRSGIRLLGRRGDVLYERSDSAQIGISMPALVQRIQALLDDEAAPSVQAWQWPLPIAVPFAVAVLVVASGLLPLFGALRRLALGPPSPEAEARRSDSGAAYAMAAIAMAVGLGALYVAPAVSYRCEAAGGSATCVVERRMAGLLVLERETIQGIVRAEWDARTIVERKRVKPNTRRRETSESLTLVALYAADDRPLFEDEQSGAIGASARDIAERIRALVDGSGPAAFQRWQIPWVPVLLASVALLLGIPMLCMLLAATVGGPGARVLALGTGFLGALLAAMAGWSLALLGRWPG